MGLAYELALCPRGKAKIIAPVLKSIEEANNNAMLLKSFTLERSVIKINVMQARNYLKKPYMKTNSSMQTSQKRTEKAKKEKPAKNENSDELLDVSNVFDEKKQVSTEKVEIKRFTSYKLQSKRNSFNSGFTDLTVD